MGTAIVELSGVATKFGEHWVHRHIDLTIPEGEVVALVGGSGSGKTTLLRQMVGLLTPTKGIVRLFGEPIFEGEIMARRARLRRLGMLFQQGALFSALSVFDNVAFPLREQGVAKEFEIRDLVIAKLLQVELTPGTVHLMPSELSGGMIKRVALARALALEPELLLLDEPTAGLDPERSMAFVKLMQRLIQTLKITVVLVTHDVETLYALATRVAVLDEGKMISFDTLENTMKLDHPFIQGFFASLRTPDSKVVC